MKLCVVLMSWRLVLRNSALIEQSGHDLVNRHSIIDAKVCASANISNLLSALYMEIVLLTQVSMWFESLRGSSGRRSEGVLGIQYSTDRRVKRCRAIVSLRESAF